MAPSSLAKRVSPRACQNRGMAWAAPVALLVFLVASIIAGVRDAHVPASDLVQEVCLDGTDTCEQDTSGDTYRFEEVDLAPAAVTGGIVAVIAALVTAAVCGVVRGALTGAAPESWDNAAGNDSDGQLLGVVDAGSTNSSRGVGLGIHAGGGVGDDKLPGVAEPPPL
jgi:hypothetical protein